METLVSISGRLATQYGAKFMVRTKVDRSRKLAEMQAYAEELAAIQQPAFPTYDPDWYLFVPTGVVYVNELAGEVFMDGKRYWLRDLEEDARAATAL